MMSTKFFTLMILMAILSISCEKKPKIPGIITAEISDITTNSAVSGGEITDDGGASIISMGICWGASDNPTIENNFINVSGNTASFTGQLTGLLPKSRYFIRAFASNSAGTGYGESRTFTTLGDTPSVTVANANNISINSAVLNGTVTPHSLPTTVVFEFGKSAEYGNTISASQVPVSGSESISLSALVSNLLPGTTYHFRMKAENSLGIIYSSDMTFRTSGDMPVIILPGAVAAVNTVTFKGSVNPNYLATTVSFEWGISDAYGNTFSLQDPVSGNELINLSANILGLTPETTYHFRIIAINALGTTRSQDMSFTTFTVADLENNYYHSVKIGTQTWFVENLKSTRFNDGTSIPLVTSQNDWNSARTYACCYYNNSSVNSDNYGAMYNYYVVNMSSNGRKNVCPAGWHVPAKAEWSTLFSFLTDNGYGNDGNGNDIAKSLAAGNGWNTDLTPGSVGNNLSDNNRSGFTALAGGIRTDAEQGFIQMGVRGSWWGTPDDYSLGFSYWCNDIFNFESIVHQANASSNYGLSIRCIKD